VTLPVIPMNTSSRHHQRPLPSSPLPFLFIFSWISSEPNRRQRLSTLIQTREEVVGFYRTAKRQAMRFAFRRRGGAGLQSLVLPPFGAKLQLQRRVRELKLLTTLYSVATLPHTRRRQGKKRTNKDDEAGLDEGGKRATGE
jgi:hypothetical protein